MKFTKWAIVIVYMVLMLILLVLNPQFSIKNQELDVVIGTINFPPMTFVFLLSLLFLVILALVAHIEEQHLTNKIEKIRAEELKSTVEKIDAISQKIQENLEELKGKLSVIEAVVLRGEETKE